ncbi:TRAP transporter small permease [Microbacterium sp. NC79]|uniref:TRAP transporter small permease n=1 Tax=Microbacterium sp. NC79 TaxID=2851009 RepID=UPI001C2C234D|nr:TRAP transporter small permease [Microbacterium sp. NC79]MBV0895769.1 TRAP transporter small permease [Microbacterium sp. NC79]
MLDVILRRVENALIAITFLFITLLAFANVVARYVFHASFSFTSELLVNLAVLLTMVGAAAATRLGTHPAFTLLRDSSRGVLRKVLVVIVCVGMLVFFAIFLWLGVETALKQLESGRLTPALQIPQWIFSMGLPFGALLGVIRTVQVAVIELRGGEAFSSEEAEAIQMAERIQVEEQAKLDADLAEVNAAAESAADVVDTDNVADTKEGGQK